MTEITMTPADELAYELDCRASNVGYKLTAGKAVRVSAIDVTRFGVKPLIQAIKVWVKQDAMEEAHENSCAQGFWEEVKEKQYRVWGERTPDGGVKIRAKRIK